MQIITNPKELSSLSSQWRGSGLQVALVPTMGYFHQGHLGLMRAAKNRAGKVIVSLFVNPSQFAPGEDLQSYPRDPERDAALAAEVGVDVLFCPAPEDIYPPSYATWVEVPTLASGLCGLSRPQHFRGVCTVVLKLLNLATPNLAVFGEKDWQQLAIIRRMVLDLNLDVEIVGQPITREADGLAMSSRNAYLLPEERAQAPGIRQGLLAVRDLVAAGECASAVHIEVMCNFLHKNVPSGVPDYIAVVDPYSLETLGKIEKTALMAVAVKLGKARLIDNILLDINNAGSAG